MSEPEFARTVVSRAEYDDLKERNEMLRDIALSAVALKLTIEHGLPVTLDALNRDLDRYAKRFGHERN
jgi:hypothetical protein